MKKSIGFTLIELIITLISLTFIFLIMFNIISSIRQQRETNQIADEIHSFNYSAVKYINANYRKLVNSLKTTDEIIPYNVFSSFAAQGTTNTTYNEQTSCLYLTAAENNTLRAFLFIGNTTKTRPLSYTQTTVIANSIGDNTGILVKAASGFHIRGVLDNNYLFSQSVINMIGNNCNFYGNKVAENSLIVDLTKNRNLFASLQSQTDKNAMQVDDDPSLKKNNGTQNKQNNMTMQTNLYFDNVVKESTSLAPAQHSYKALDFGKAMDTGQRIQIKATASPGIESKTSQLAIYNAGIQAGFIAPVSHQIRPGSECLAKEIGKVAQEQNQDIISAGGQLQCTYNPTFCQASHYCYLPTKTASIIKDYNPPTTEAICPSGTIVDSQYQDTIDKNVICSTGTGTLVGVTVVGVDCYQSVNNFSYCLGYSTVCRYNNNGVITNVPIAALAHLRCTNDTSTYVVNYTPTN